MIACLLMWGITMFVFFPGLQLCGIRSKFVWSTGSCKCNMRSVFSMLQLICQRGKDAGMRRVSARVPGDPVAGTSPSSERLCVWSLVGELRFHMPQGKTHRHTHTHTHTHARSSIVNILKRLKRGWKSANNRKIKVRIESYVGWVRIRKESPLKW